jgi:putative glutathione S-transferase
VQSKDGTYQRPSYSFKDQLGSPGFPLEKGRYHLYVGNACPWCHRVLLALVVCGLEEYVRWVPLCYAVLVQ